MNGTRYLQSSDLQDLKRGFREDIEGYGCLICGAHFERGIVYPDEGVLYEAKRFIQRHIEKVHGPVFSFALSLDRRWTGLTDQQKNLLGLFWEGKSDHEIQSALGIGSLSTIRNHRFALREKARQAKILLAIVELLEDRESKKQEKDVQMASRKELIRQFKQTLPPMGIYQIRNLNNGKVFIGRSSNLTGKLNSERLQLQTGTHPSEELRADFKAQGEANFAFEVLDYLEPLDRPDQDYTKDLIELEAIWIEKIQPFGDKGYNFARRPGK